MYSQVAQVGKGKGLGGTLDLTEKQSLRLSQLKIHSGPEPQLVTSMRRIDIVYLSQAERSGTGTIVTNLRKLAHRAGPFYCIVHRYECTHQGGPCDNVHVQAS